MRLEPCELPHSFSFQAATCLHTCPHALLAFLQLREQLEVAGHLCDCHGLFGRSVDLVGSRSLLLLV